MDQLLDIDGAVRVTQDRTVLGRHTAISDYVDTVYLGPDDLEQVISALQKALDRYRDAT